MTPFMIYQVKVAIGIMLFTGIYHVLFRKETFYRMNRIYLLSTLVLSALLPLIRFPDFNPPQAEAVNTFISAVTLDAGTSPAMIPVQRVPVTVVLYRILMLLFTLHLVYHVVRLLMAVIHNGSIKLNHFRIITLSKKEQSFSFFNLIFIASPFNNESGESQVLQHEMAHARQWHSIDILLIQFFKIFQWFNPFIYLAEKEMQETHEYLADEAVLEQDGDSGGYRLLLLTRVFGVQPGIVSLFNYSLIKNRLIMMTKEKSPLRNRLKYLIALPVTFFIVFMLSCTGREAEESLLPPPPPPPPVDAEKANAGIDVDKITDNDSVFVLVDEQARFQGGSLETFRDWVQKNVIYPKEAINKGIIGRVTVQFTVNSLGKVESIKILRGVDPLLDAETVRVIGSSPDWEPGRYKDRDVKQQFVMPVIFQLSSEKVTKSTDKVVMGDDPAFIFVEEQAKFQGGSLETFREWVQKNLVYPKKAVENGIFGRVTVQFIVNKEGKTGDVKILRGVDPLLDEETIRVIRSSPKWEPAGQGGQPVSQQFVMPVVFALQ